MKWKADHTAYLSSEGAYTFFRFQDRTISFLTGKNLDRYHKQRFIKKHYKEMYTQWTMDSKNGFFQ